MKFAVPHRLYRKFRLRRILKRQKRVADFWDPLIDAYLGGNIASYRFPAKSSFDTDRIIWQYWGQGIDRDNLPEVIRICFDSVDRYRGVYRVVRLSDENISQYIDLPDFVYEKMHRYTAFTRTFFSDLLRVSLLATYGGVWLDATVLLTDTLPEEFAKMDYFMYQRSGDEPHKEYWENTYAPYFGWHPDFKVRVLNSIVFSQKESLLIRTIQDLLLYFWNTQNRIPDYFFFQILYRQLIAGKLAALQCPVVNDCIPHILQTKINGDYPYHTFEETCAMTSMHKMAYFTDEGVEELKKVIASL